MGRIKLWISSGSSAVTGAPSLLLFLTLSVACFLLPVVLHSQSLTELGSEGDLSVLGTGGSATDPNVKIKGFTVFGSTQASYTGAAAGNGNVVVNGYLSVSSGAYFVGGSTFSVGGAYFSGVSSFSSVGNIYVTGGVADQVLASQGPGVSLKWTPLSALGDDLGDHVATTTLNMNSWNLVGVSSVNFRSNVFITSGSAAAQYGGVYVSTHIYTPGDIYAGNLYGNGSGLTGIAARTYVTRALAAGANSYIYIGNFSVTNGAHNLYVAVTVSDAGFSAAKQYAIPLYNNMTGASWNVALPVSNTGPGASGDDFALEVNVSGATATLRLRRTAGSTAGTALVSMETIGSSADVFTSDSTTGADAAAYPLLAVTAVSQTGGRVGIGTASPGATLDIKAGAGNTYAVNVSSNNGTGLMVVQHNGNVGIGTANPGAKLDAAGMVRSTWAFSPGDGNAFQSSRYMYDDSANYRTAFSSNVYIVGYASVTVLRGLSAPLTGDSAATKAYVDAALDTCALGSAVPADIVAGKSADINCDNFAEVGTLAAQTLAVSTDEVKTGVYAATWLSAVDTDLAAANIRSGFNIFGHAGTFTSGATAAAGNIMSGLTAGVNGAIITGTLPTQTLNPANDTVTAGYYNATTLSAVDPDLAAGNIAVSTVVFGITGTYTSDANAAASDILTAKTAYVNGVKLTGALATQTLNPANDTVTAGYYNATTLSAVDPDLAAGNIAVSTTIFGKLGTYTSDATATAANILSGQTAYVNGVKITGTVPAGANVSGGEGLKTFTITDGLYSGNKTATANDTDLAAGNIKSGVTIFAVTGTLETAPPAPSVGGTWLLVPGNSALGTRDFYVQKYEAKNVTSVPTSNAADFPWVSISQTDAKRYCTALGAGYHLLTMEEAQTISRNIENVGGNWVNGTVGSGGLWRGHTDNAPANSLAADVDSSSYTGTGNTYPSIEKRTHQLSSGETIWDWSGNVWEWVDMTCVGGTGTGLWDATAAWQEWSAAALSDYEKGRAGPAGAYTAADNAGRYYGCTATANAVLRGGSWGAVATAGVFAFAADNAPSLAYTYIGFRCGR